MWSLGRVVAAVAISTERSVSAHYATTNHLRLPLGLCPSPSLISTPLYPLDSPFIITKHPESIRLLNQFAAMRFSPIIFLMTGLMTGHALGGPTGTQDEMANIEQRGCGTGNWCCTVANPSSYCNTYCTGGSAYLNCYGSYVSWTPSTPSARTRQNSF